MFRLEHNVETGEVKEIALTPAEIKLKEKEAQETADLIAKQSQTEAQKAEAKAALLERLGITEEEAKLLLS